MASQGGGANWRTTLAGRMNHVRLGVLKLLYLSTDKNNDKFWMDETGTIPIFTPLMHVEIQTWLSSQVVNELFRKCNKKK